jgi:hypothetical protein
MKATLTRFLIGTLMIFALFACKNDEKAAPADTARTDTASTETATTDPSGVAASAGSGTPTVTTTCSAPTGFACVTLKITGLAHLVNNGDGTRKLIVPKVAMHETLLLTEENKSELSDDGLLNKKDEQLEAGQNPGDGREFFFRKFPAGHEIDLEKSGWVKPSRPKLVADETGDPSEECPDPAKAPKESLHWLPHLATVSKHSGTPKLDKEFTKKDPLDTKVIAHLNFVDGVLSAELTGAAHGKFQFTKKGKPASGEHVQAISSFLKYPFHAKLESVTIDGKTEQLIVIRGRKFKQPSQTTETFDVIARFKPDSSRNVEIVLANVVNFFKLEKVQKVGHFPRAYDIFDATTPVAATIPVRTSECGEPGDSGVECGPDRVP